MKLPANRTQIERDIKQLKQRQKAKTLLQANLRELKTKYNALFI